MEQNTNKKIAKIDKQIERTEKKIARRVPMFLYEIFEKHYDDKKAAMRKKVVEYQKQKHELQDMELNKELNRSR